MSTNEPAPEGPTQIIPADYAPDAATLAVLAGPPDQEGEDA